MLALSMMLSNLTIAKIKIYLPLAAVAMVIFVLTALVLVPDFLRLKDIWQQQTLSRQRLIILKEKSASLEDLNKEFLLKRFQDLESFLANDKKIAQAMAFLEHTALNSVVEIIELDISPGSLDSARSEGVDLLMMPLTMRGRGSLNSIESFVSSLTQGAPANSIKKLNLDGWREKSAAGITVGGEIVFYNQPLRKILPEITTSLPQFGSGEEELWKKVSSLLLVRPATETPTTIEVGRSNPFAPF